MALEEKPGPDANSPETPDAGTADPVAKEAEAPASAEAAADAKTPDPADAGADDGAPVEDAAKAAGPADDAGEATPDQPADPEAVAKAATATAAVAAAGAPSTPAPDADPAADEKPVPPKVVEIRPMARKAKMRKRHWVVLFSFFIAVIVPLMGVYWYLTQRATDQYMSVAGFSVRQEDSASAAEMVGGLAQFMGGGSGAGDTDIIYEFIQSQGLVAQIDEKLGLRAHYTAPYDTDPVFALKPGGTIEDLLAYWERVVRIAYDQATGLINVRVVAFTPDMAQAVANEIIAASQALVNEINLSARADMLRYAEEDLDKALIRLKDAREAMILFRTRTQIVDPASDLEGRMGVLNGLQRQLAESLIEYDLLAQSSSDTDPRVIQASRRIEVIRVRIDEERNTISATDGGGEAYPDLLAEYEGLVVQREFSEETYRVALSTLDVARANAVRQSRYLATYVSPTLAEKSEYPQRSVLLGLAGLFLFLLWAILSLTLYSLRDRR